MRHDLQCPVTCGKQKQLGCSNSWLRSDQVLAIICSMRKRAGSDRCWTSRKVYEDAKDVTMAVHSGHQHRCSRVWVQKQLHSWSWSMRGRDKLVTAYCSATSSSLAKDRNFFLSSLDHGSAKWYPRSTSSINAEKNKALLITLPSHHFPRDLVPCKEHWFCPSQRNVAI